MKRPFIDDAGRLRDVPILDIRCWSGDPRKRITTEDLDDIVRNFKPWTLQYRVPMRFYRDLPDTLENYKIPEAYVYNLHRVGELLVGDFEEVSDTAKLLPMSTDWSVSVEIYHRPPEGLPATIIGKVLRRVAIIPSRTVTEMALASHGLPASLEEIAPDFIR